jgi:hypothetical protein
VNLALAQREVALAGIALLAATTALALASPRFGSDGGDLPQAVPAPGGGWYTALAATEPETDLARRSACGHIVDVASVGVAHPVLPCGAKLWLLYEHKQVLTQVIDRGPLVPGREFGLTPELARELDVSGTQRIRWRFAR